MTSFLPRTRSTTELGGQRVRTLPAILNPVKSGYVFVIDGTKPVEYSLSGPHSRRLWVTGIMKSFRFAASRQKDHRDQRSFGGHRCHRPGNCDRISAPSPGTSTPALGGPAPSTFCRSFAHGVALAFITEQASTFKAAPQHSTKAPATPARGAKRPGGPPWFMGVLGPPWGHRRGSRHQPVASLGTVEGRRVHRRRVIGADCGVGTPAIGPDAGWPPSSLVAQPAGT